MTDSVRPEDSTPALDHIRGLCANLSSYAEDLDALRGADPGNARLPGEGKPSGTALWGGTIGGQPRTRNGAAPWYQPVEELYRRLDGPIRAGDPALCEKVLSDSTIREMEPGLHRLRAAYEYDKELDFAEAILAQSDRAERLAMLLDKEIYWTLWPALRRAFAGCRRVLVAGCGPLPLTALSIAVETGARVTCIERFHRGCELAQQLIDIAGYDDRISCVEADGVELTSLDGYDTVMPATLLGVPMSDNERNRKDEGMANVVARMGPKTRLVMRDPHDLGCLLYPPVKLSALPELNVDRLVAEAGPDQPYRLSIIVGRRRGIERQKSERKS